jgi:hypothetical protein
MNYEAIVVNKADYPIMIAIKGDNKVVSPRERFSVEKLSDLPALIPDMLRVQKLV